MKSKTLSRRLKLNKTTIANLNPDEMKRLFAGVDVEEDKVVIKVSGQTCPQLGCVISTYTYYTCEPWSCAPYCPIQEEVVAA